MDILKIILIIIFIILGIIFGGIALYNSYIMLGVIIFFIFITIIILIGNFYDDNDNNGSGTSPTPTPTPTPTPGLSPPGTSSDKPFKKGDLCIYPNDGYYSEYISIDDEKSNCMCKKDTYKNEENGKIRCEPHKRCSISGGLVERCTDVKKDTMKDFNKYKDNLCANISSREGYRCKSGVDQCIVDTSKPCIDPRSELGKKIYESDKCTGLGFFRNTICSCPGNTHVGAEYRNPYGYSNAITYYYGDKCQNNCINGDGNIELGCPCGKSSPNCEGVGFLGMGKTCEGSTNTDEPGRICNKHIGGIK